MPDSPAGPGAVSLSFAGGRSTAVVPSPSFGPAAPALPSPDALSTPGSSPVFPAAEEEGEAGEGEGEGEREEALRAAEKAAQAEEIIHDAAAGEVVVAAGFPVFVVSTPTPLPAAAATSAAGVFPAGGAGDAASFRPAMSATESTGGRSATGSTPSGPKSGARSGGWSASGEPSLEPTSMLEPEPPPLPTPDGAFGAARADVLVSLALPAAAALG